MKDIHIYTRYKWDKNIVVKQDARRKYIRKKGKIITRSI